jgi:cell division protein FtsB
MLAIKLPTWLVDIWAVHKDVIVPALIMVLTALLTWVAIKIKADAKYQQAKSELQIQELKKLNEREDTRPELNTLSAEVEDTKQSVRYLAEMFDKVFQNSTLDENTKNELTLLKNKLVFGVKEDLVETLTAEKTALEEQIAGLTEQLNAATTVITKETRTRR